MWWNPLNSIKHKTAAREEYLASRRRSRGAEDPATTSYWAEGDGSRLQWKFDCICGEVCSYYEKHIYHPTGRMYECTSCNFWSHVRCNFGDISDDKLEQKKVYLNRNLCKLRSNDNDYNSRTSCAISVDRN
jgi:hypothetical protein